MYKQLCFGHWCQCKHNDYYRHYYYETRWKDDEIQIINFKENNIDPHQWRLKCYNFSIFVWRMMFIWPIITHLCVITLWYNISMSFIFFYTKILDFICTSLTRLKIIDKIFSIKMNLFKFEVLTSSITNWFRCYLIKAASDFFFFSKIKEKL